MYALQVWPVIALLWITFAQRHSLHVLVESAQTVGECQLRQCVGGIRLVLLLQHSADKIPGCPFSGVTNACKGPLEQLRADLIGADL